MFWKRPAPQQNAAYDKLPLTPVIIGAANAKMAVHVRGNFGGMKLPIVCLADYHRNMLDYLQFAEQFHRLASSDWPIVLIDFQGRGRSSSRRNKSHYTSVNDASDVLGVMDALGISKSIFVGQGYGGQVIMTLGAVRQQMISGAILVNAGPITDTPGLVRLRDNLHQINDGRGERYFKTVTRQIFGATHPGMTEAEMDELALRTHELDHRGRVKPLFDPHLLSRLNDLQIDDVFEPQWQLFSMLDHAELLLVRTQLNEQLQRATFDRMLTFRPDATRMVVPGQGTPALLSSDDDVQTIINFATSTSANDPLQPIVAG